MSHQTGETATLLRSPRKETSGSTKTTEGTPGKVLNCMLLERLQKAVDGKLRENQGGFRNNKSCADQIATLRITID